jgi:hypothetical protein
MSAKKNAARSIGKGEKNSKPKLPEIFGRVIWAGTKLTDHERADEVGEGNE